MKDGKAQSEIEWDERDVEDMRKDDIPVVAEPRRAKRGHGARDWARATKIIDPGAPQAQ